MQFYLVDVFAQTALAGNPLALVPAADALTPDTMRAIAREFNQSETTFLVAPTVPDADYRLRSFTPGGVEVLGAGHNAMGATALSPTWFFAEGYTGKSPTQEFREYITIDSWVDTNSICTGKFEWCDAGYTMAIDRDKSWIADDPANLSLAPIGEANVDLNTGGVRLQQALNFDISHDTDKGAGDTALDYNSATTNVRPVVDILLTTDSSQPLPSAIKARLTWNGTTGSWVTFTTSGHSSAIEPRSEMVRMLVGAPPAVSRLSRATVRASRTVLTNSPSSSLGNDRKSFISGFLAARAITAGLFSSTDWVDM